MRTTRNSKAAAEAAAVPPASASQPCTTIRPARHRKRPSRLSSIPPISNAVVSLQLCPTHLSPCIEEIGAALAADVLEQIQLPQATVEEATEGQTGQEIEQRNDILIEADHLTVVTVQEPAAMATTTTGETGEAERQPDTSVALNIVSDSEEAAAALSAVQLQPLYSTQSMERPTKRRCYRVKPSLSAASIKPIRSEKELEERGIAFQENERLAKSTRREYANAIERAKSWAKLAKESGASYADGLEQLSANSALFCQRWIESHIEEEGVSYSSISMMHAAFVDYFNIKFKCQKKRAVGWEEIRPGVFKGNPAYSVAYLNILDGAARKHGREHKDVRRAQPMLYPDLSSILISIDNKLKVFDADRQVISPERTRLEFMRAFMILSYRLWTRCEETCRLNWADIDREVTFSPIDHVPVIGITLTFRKTNQADPSKANYYLLRKLPNRPLACAIEAVHRWRNYWEFAAQKKLDRHDLVFPSMYYTTGQLHFQKQLKSTDINIFLGRMEEIQLLSADKTQSYSTHCFRRGGLQDSLLLAHNYSEQPVALAKAKWWGGWSEHESNNTLFRYLFDEANKAEHWHGDMELQAPIHPRTEYFAGGSGTIYTENLRQMMDAFESMQVRLDKQSVMVQELLSRSKAPSSPEPVHLLESLVRCLAQQPPAASKILSSSGLIGQEQETATPCATVNAPVHQDKEASEAISQQRLKQHEAAQHLLLQVPLPIPILAGSCLGSADGKPLPKHIPEAQSLEHVVEQWEKGDKTTNLLALSEWPRAMRQKGFGGNAATYSNRKLVYTAYKEVGRSYEAFYQRYGKDKTLKEYMILIKQRKKELDPPPAKTLLQSLNPFASSLS